MTGNKKAFFLIVTLPLILSFLLVSCARKSPKLKEKSPPAQAVSEELATDEALGVLKEGETDVEKELKELRDEAEHRQALREQEQREREEEQQRIQRKIAEDAILVTQ